MMETMRNAHSAAGMTSGCFLYSRSKVRAAFFRTKLCEVLSTTISEGKREYMAVLTER